MLSRFASLILRIKARFKSSSAFGDDTECMATLSNASPEEAEHRERLRSRSSNSRASRHQSLRTRQLNQIHQFEYRPCPLAYSDVFQRKTRAVHAVAHA